MDKKTEQLAHSKAEHILPISESCGTVALGCSDVAGLVQSVLHTSRRLREEHDALHQTVVHLEADQRMVAQATGEASMLAGQAITQLGQGTFELRRSLGEIAQLVELVGRLANRVTGFTAAMKQVRHTSKKIEDIAETTRILALNAKIEAVHAGEAGRTFLVVANEVKCLAVDTRKATEEITLTVEKLNAEALDVIFEIENGVKSGNSAKTSIYSIERTIDDVTGLVREVSSQNDQIVRATGTISGHVDLVREVLTSFDVAVQDNEANLGEANKRIEALELTACEMFDQIVHAELSPDDSRMVERALAASQEVSGLIEDALSNDSLNLESLFDRDYKPILASNPLRYINQFTCFADTNLRPVLDRLYSADPKVETVVVSDVNGYLPTHLTDRSREPTGDIAHDTAYCRNGRILLEGVDLVAKQSTASYMMAVYRHEAEGGRYDVVRNIYVPLVIAGRRWGDFELAYIL